MKNLITKTALRVAMSLTILLSVTAASAESVGRFQIPFQFLMGDKVLPAGDYKVSIDTASGRIRLSSWEAGASVHLTANTPHRANAAAGKLVFNKYGRVRALREMWRSGSTQGHELTMSKAEREIARQSGTNSILEVVATRQSRKPFSLGFRAVPEKVPEERMQFAGSEDGGLVLLSGIQNSK